MIRTWHSTTRRVSDLEIMKKRERERERFYNSTLKILTD